MIVNLFYLLLYKIIVVAIETPFGIMKLNPVHRNSMAFCHRRISLNFANGFRAPEAIGFYILKGVIYYETIVHIHVVGCGIVYHCWV